MEKKLLLAKNILQQADLLDTIKKLESKLNEDGEGSEAEEWKTELKDLSEELAGVELSEIKICADLNKSSQSSDFKIIEPKFQASTSDIFSRQEGNTTSIIRTEQPNNHDDRLHHDRPISRNFFRSVPKPDKFQKGQNFSRFVRRFVQYITLSNMEGENLDLLFLSFIDHDETFEKLSRVELSESEKRNLDSLVERFEREIYPKIASQTLKSELQNLCQNSQESAEEFAFRISEIADKAYDNMAVRNESA